MTITAVRLDIVQMNRRYTEKLATWGRSKEDFAPVERQICSKLEQMVTQRRNAYGQSSNDNHQQEHPP